MDFRLVTAMSCRVAPNLVYLSWLRRFGVWEPRSHRYLLVTAIKVLLCRRKDVTVLPQARHVK